MAKKRRSTSRQAAPEPAIPAAGRWLGAAVLLAALAAFILWMLMRSDTPKPTFSGERAYGFLVQQVEMGPRVPGTEAHAQTLAFLADTLRLYADRVGQQTVPYTDRGDTSRTYEGTNLIASFNLDAGRRVMLAAHWDTRPIADQDPDLARRTEPVPGANDGASGAAVLLEMARLLREQPPEVGVDLVFFDLEDLGDDIDPDSLEAGVVDSTAINPFAIGSAYFAEHYGTYRPSFGILLDMVCDRDLRIPKELYSNRYARPIVDKVWAAAERVGAPAFLDEEGQAVMDDHVPFLQRGIPVIDLIHTPFPDYWHTTADTPDKCSAASLQQVGEVLVEVVYSE